jgi:hypothetical protein
VATQRLCIGGADRGGRKRELERVVAERLRAVVELGLAIVVLGVRRELVCGALGTEVVGV